MFTKTILVMVVLIMTTMLPKHVQRKLKKNKSFMTCWVSCEPLVYRQMSKRKLLAFQRQANAAKLQWPNLTKAGLFLKVLQISQENTCARVSYSDTGAFLWILRHFSEHIFYKTTPSDCLWLSSHLRIILTC